jgi:ubiquinone/menaquinone biosynthesis C-methylase UbiE
MTDLEIRVAGGDIEHLGFDDDHFDIALVNEVLEHVPDDRRKIREVYRVLKPGGLIVARKPD